MEKYGKYEWNYRAETVIILIIFKRIIRFDNRFQVRALETVDEHSHKQFIERRHKQFHDEQFS